MTLARTWSIALTGLRGELIEVEADLTAHQPDFRIIGLPDKALGEAVRRVTNACENSGLQLPYRRLTVGLSPAALPKQGSGFDLAIALAALATDGRVSPESVARTVHLGEVGLDGRVRPFTGILPSVVAAAAAGKTRVMVPWANRAEAALVPDVEVIPIVSLGQAAVWHGAAIEAPDAVPVDAPIATTASDPVVDLVDVVGQELAIRALIVTAAGGHHLMLSGPPGAGKTMLARRLPGILPELDDDAALDAACIRSLSGDAVTGLDRVPPFEAPHHSASTAALVGGGSRFIRPGVIARASGGVLFLDEAAEASRATLDALRQPLESGQITIHRAGVSASYPARFQLVLATNPCPCGQFGVRGGSCVCAPNTVRRYAQRLSGPLRDRIDLDVRMERVVSVSDRARSAFSTADARDRVRAARDRARRRWRETPWTLNAQVPGSRLRQSAHRPPPEVTRPLDAALQRGRITLRGYDRVLRVALTVADLNDRATPNVDDISEALFLRQGG